MSDDPIVVTGLGAVCPLGTGASAVWRAFAAGESGVRELAPDDDRLAPGVDVTPPAQVRRAGWVRGFRPRDHVRSPQLRRMDWCSRMAVASIRQAFEDAALLPLGDATSARTALVVGSCYGNQRETAVYLQRVFASGPAAGQPLLFPNLVLNAGAGYAAIELDVRGPNICVAEHEASGEVALATALDLLQSGACDVACVAGVDEIGAVQLEALSDLRLLHPDAEPSDATAARRRTGRGRRGAVLPGEGAAALVLERASRAAERGVAAYARVAGARVGALADDGSPYGFPRDGAAAANRLLELASASGPDVDGVLGGANGLALRDALDTAVLDRLRAGGRRVGYAPFRRLVGDWGTAGALGAVLASLALDAGVLPGVPSEGAKRAEPAVQLPKRLLLIGAARGGVLVPVVLDRSTGPSRCSSTASTSSSSSRSS
jgi:3-oxoacyl-[acyl-carrier-protein] synthase II